MAYQISTTQIDPSTGLSHLQTLNDLAIALNWAAFYVKIFEYTALPDDNGNAADLNVRQWFNVASQANAGLGASSDLIRDYTLAQIEIRTGVSASAHLMDEASDAIAEAIWLNHIIDGRLPTLEDIRLEDAQSVVTALQDNGHNVGFEVWSGNILFVGLGDTQPLLDNLIPASSQSSYDLFAAGQSLSSVGLGSILGAGWNSLGTFLGNSGSVLSANNAIDDFLARLYGVLAPTSSAAAFWNSQVGLQGDQIDQLVGSDTRRDAIHGGDGNDEIIGSQGNDIIDGGSGIDLVSFEALSAAYGTIPLEVRIFDVTSDVQFSAQVFTSQANQNENTSNLFDVERLMLGISDDVVRWIGNISSTTTALFEIDGGDNGNMGDTLDFRAAHGSINLNLDSGNFGSGSYSGNFLNFENVLGGNGDDTIQGNDKNNIIEGGLGHDVLRGEAGDNLIFANAFLSVGLNDSLSSSQLWGGTGNDILVADAGGNTLRGGSGSNLLIGGSGDDILEGGDGHDYIISGGGRDEIRGGKGNDWINALAPGADVIVFFDQESGNDYIEQNSIGYGHNGVSAIIFEELNINDVTFIWNYKIIDYEFVEPEISIDGFTLYEYTTYMDLLGDALIYVNSTGATINIGQVAGRAITYERYNSFSPDTLDAHSTQISAVMLNYHQITFENGNSRDPYNADENVSLINFYLYEDIKNASLNETRDDGFFSHSNFLNSEVGQYLGAPQQFANNFSNSFVDNNAVFMSGTTDIASILSEDAVNTLTSDHFEFV
jgi:Ca2+-binding RTX toxin-like protein